MFIRAHGALISRSCLPDKRPDLVVMRILLLNVPHPSIGSRIPDDHLPPLGLLCIGGPLIDEGHDVGLIDADLATGRRTTYSAEAIAAEAAAWRPDAVLSGHSGSTSSALRPVRVRASAFEPALAGFEALLEPDTLTPAGFWPDCEDLSAT